MTKITHYPSKHATVKVLLDLYSAFDNIDHTVMIRRLQIIGLSDVVLTWFTSYLTDTTYSTHTGSYKPELGLIAHGMPLDSVLEPIHFNIYSSPLLDIIDNYSDIHFHTYAYDMELYCNLHDHTSNISRPNNCLDDIRL